MSHGRIRQFWNWLFDIVPDDQPHECMYGKRLGAEGNCTIVVPPHQGWRDGALVFCSEEHAALDQEDQVF